MSDPPSPHSKNVEHELSSPELADPDAMNASDQQGGSNSYDFDLKEQDRWLPIANVARIMKNALPDNAKIAKEAKECMQECVSEFISFVTSEASEKCQQEKRKTVNGEDIIFSMTSLGFENYAEALKIFLARHRDIFPNPRRSDRTDAQIGAQSNSQSATQHEQGWRQQSGDEGEDRRYSYSSQQELSGDPDAM